MGVGNYSLKSTLLPPVVLTNTHRIIAQTVINVLIDYQKFILKQMQA